MLRSVLVRRQFARYVEATRRRGVSTPRSFGHGRGFDSDLCSPGAVVRQRRPRLTEGIGARTTAHLRRDVWCLGAPRATFSCGAHFWFVSGEVLSGSDGRADGTATSGGLPQNSTAGPTGTMSRSRAPKPRRAGTDLAQGTRTVNPLGAWLDDQSADSIPPLLRVTRVRADAGQANRGGRVVGRSLSLSLGFADSSQSKGKGCPSASHI